MPLQRQNNVYSYTANTEDRESFDEIEPSLPLPSPTTQNGTSWKLLRQIFGASRSFSMGKGRDDGVIDLNSKKQRKISCEQHISSEKGSPTGLRRLSVGIQRKVSNSKPPSVFKSRKFSAVNSQENLLHYFVTESDMSTLKNILQNNKVDINFMRPPGLSPLHTACALGDINIVELLIQYGADIHLKTWSGLSPLQITTLFGHFDVAQYLIKNGASSKEIQDGFTSDTKLISTVLVCM